MVSGRALALALGCALVAPVSMIWGGAPAWAAQETAPVRHYVLSAGPLADVLARFAAAAGVPLSFDPNLLAGRASAGLEGDFTVPGGFARLLAGSGFVAVDTGAGRYGLRQVSADGAMTLDPVTVESAVSSAALERATGPVQGYVAKRSATATKTDTAIVDTPQSISVVGAEELQTRHVQTLEDAIKYTPGAQLTYGAVGDSRSSWYRMRGFPVTTTFFRDGLMATGASWQKIDSSVLERVEILRGPASVVFGRGIPGGVVNTVTKRPEEVQRGEATVEYGSNDWKRAQADITGPIDDKGHWFYRLTAAAQDSEGMNGIDHDRNNRKVFAPAVTWRPQEGSEVTVMALHQEDESRGWWPRKRIRTTAGTTSPSTYLGDPDYDKYEQTQNHLSVIAEHAIDDSLKVSLSARYSKYDMDYQQVWPGTVQSGGTTISRYNYGYSNKADVYAIDTRVEKKLAVASSQHTLLGGVDYLYQDRGQYYGSATATTVNIFAPVNTGTSAVTSRTYSKYDMRSPGVYAQDQIELGRWLLLLGGREDMAGTSSGTAYDDTFTGRAGLAYRTGFGLVPYASYAESFEPQSGSGWGGGGFEPTTGRQYEVGAKYEPPGTNMLASVAVFDLVKQNVLTTDPDETHLCSGSRCNVQTGEVRSRGVELGLTMGLAEGLNAVAAYTYNPVSVTKSNTASEVGRQQADTPIHTASLWMDYTFGSGPLSGFGLGGGLRFLGRTTSSAGDVSTSPQLLDEAMVRYDYEDWRLSLNARNLLDRDIEYSCSRSGTTETCYLQEPLTLTARISRRF